MCSCVLDVHKTQLRMFLNAMMVTARAILSVAIYSSA